MQESDVSAPRVGRTLQLQAEDPGCLGRVVDLESSPPAADSLLLDHEHAIPIDSGMMPHIDFHT